MGRAIHCISVFLIKTEDAVPIPNATDIYHKIISDFIGNLAIQNFVKLFIKR